MTPADFTVFARIGLYILTGYLAAADVDSALVTFIGQDPQVLATVTGMIAAAWYGAARFKGWRT